MKILLAKNTLWYGFFDDILIAVENTNFSHVAIEIDGYIYESCFPKSRRIKKNEWLKKYQIIRQYNHNLPYNIETMYIKYMEENLLGKPYSMGQILAIGLGMLNKSIDSFFKKKDLNNTRYLICTELVCRVLSRMYSVQIEDVETMSLVETENLIKTLRVTYGDFRKY